jgi:hypothetical protein
VVNLSPRHIARNAYLWWHDSWTNAKYSYRDRIINSPSKRIFASQDPVLNDRQQKVVQELFTRGIAFIHFDELFGDREKWNDLREEFNGFVNSNEVRDSLLDYEDGTRVGEWNKDYLIRKYPDTATLPLDSPWLELGLDERILNVVNSYLGLWSKLYFFDLWYILPLKGERQAAASQMWHRDPEDRRLVKIFLYFSEVNEGSGPLQYVPGSRRWGGPYSHLWRKRYQAYPPENEFEAEIPRSQWVTGLASPGTFVLVDTTGFHRGGYATLQPRLSATWTYVTPASYLARRLDVQPRPHQSHLSGPAAFAIT